MVFYHGDGETRYVGFGKLSHRNRAGRELVEGRSLSLSKGGPWASTSSATGKSSSVAARPEPVEGSLSKGMHR